MLSITLGVILISLLCYLIHRAHKVNQYWKEAGIKHLKPVLFFGNILPTFTKSKHQSEIYIDYIKAFPDEDIVGFYEFMRPLLLVLNPHVIEKILKKDFTHFTDHGVISPDPNKNPIDAYQLFSMKGPKWRALRSKISPLFTSGKLKSMYGSFEQCGERLVKYLDKAPKKDVLLREAMQLFTLEVAALAIFGFDAKVFENPNCTFKKMGTNIFDTGYIKLLLLIVFPKWGTKLNVSFVKKESIDYFCGIIKETFEYRMKNGIQRNDFVQMMMHLKERGKIDIHKWDSNDDYLKTDEETTETIEITDVVLMAQAFAFMSNGADPVAITLTCCLYELAMHQDVQNKAREELKEQIKQNSGLSYTALKNATYLDNVVNEMLRLHPLPIAILRVCTKDYTFPSGFTIKKGQPLHIPVLALHLNPEYHSNPLEFRPERFDHPMKPGTYLPFGDGPRVCIAMRFALLQIKYALAVTMLNYRIKLSPKVKVPIKLKPRALISQPEQPIYFDLEELEDS